MKTNVAMLVIDMQNCFLEEIGDPSVVNDACQVINFVAGMVRAAGQPVIFIKDVEEADDFSPEELDFDSRLSRSSSDLLVEKRSANAFWQTELESKLKEAGTKFLILSGQAAEQCVLFTYNGASERGYRAVMLQEGILSADPENVKNAMANRNFISWPAVKELLS